MGGLAQGPPSSLTLGSAPAKPWRSSIRAHARQRPATLWRSSIPLTLGSEERRVILTLSMSDSRRYFDDIEVGEEYESPGRTVTETDIVIFAGLSGDYNILHTDAEFMKQSIFGERIAHGLLGLSIQAGLFTRATLPYATIAFAALRWKFKGPIKIGDTIRVRARVSGKKETSKPDRGVITLERRVLNQRDEVVQEGETDLMVERHP
jgi:acyl dehydratase